MTSYSHCPPDVIATIDQYERDVASGKIIPWNPDTRDEYCDSQPEKDKWLRDHLELHLPEIYTK